MSDGHTGYSLPSIADGSIPTASSSSGLRTQDAKRPCGPAALCVTGQDGGGVVPRTLYYDYAQEEEDFESEEDDSPKRNRRGRQVGAKAMTDISDSAAPPPRLRPRRLAGTTRPACTVVSTAGTSQTGAGGSGTAPASSSQTGAGGDKHHQDEYEMTNLGNAVLRRTLDQGSCPQLQAQWTVVNAPCPYESEAIAMVEEWKVESETALSAVAKALNSEGSVRIESPGCTRRLPLPRCKQIGQKIMLSTHRGMRSSRCNIFAPSTSSSRRLARHLTFAARR